MNKDYSYVFTKDDDKKEEPKDLTLDYQCEENYNRNVMTTSNFTGNISYKVIKNTVNKDEIKEVIYDL